ETLPTYPSPNTETFIVLTLFSSLRRYSGSLQPCQRVLKVLRHGRPVIAIDHQPPGFGFNPAAQLSVANQMDDGLRESRRFVCDDDVVAVCDGKPFGADRRGDHGFRHGHGLEDLQASAAANSQRHDVD